MTDAGFFKGTSADQDSRFSDKNKKLMKTMKFADNIDKKIDMKKIRLELMRPYITNILNELTTVEDDVMVEYVFSQLEEKQHPDGKLIQIMMTGFLGKTKARTFMAELWTTLVEAQTSPHGIPAELIELKREELMKKKEEESKISASLNKNKEEIERSLRKSINHRNEVTVQQVSIQRPKSPPKVVKDTVERQKSNRDEERRRRSRTRSRSRSPKYSHRRSSGSPRRHNGSSRHSNRETERKSSRRFKEKTPEDKVNVDEKLKSLEIVKTEENHNEKANESVDSVEAVKNKNKSSKKRIVNK
jgi:hypothetical protein